MKLRVFLAGALLVAGSITVVADDKPAQAQNSDAAMMEAMAKLGAPGESHRKLDAFVGKWDTKVSSWMAPGAEAMVSTGSSENRWIMGGRYLEQRFSGSFMDAPFEGIGYTGYDNVRKEYFGTWMDSMSTGMMMSTGSVSDDAKTWTFTATMADPMTGKDTRVDEKIILVDADHHVMEMWSPGPDGKAFKMMEIAYSRKK